MQEQQHLQMAQQEPRKDVSMALAYLIYLKVSDVDLENNLRYRPLPLLCFMCAASSDRIKI